MNRLAARILFAILTLLLLVPSLYAYHLALKDGRIIQFQKYRVAGDQLYYIANDGKEVAIPLATIDLDRTQQLNAAESSPLGLPGLAASAPPGGGQAETSLDAVARRFRKQHDAKPTAKRVFTNDDFKQVVIEDPTKDSGTDKKLSPEEARTQVQALVEKYMRESEGAIANLESKTTRQLAEEITGGVNFPGHELWEEKLGSARDRLVAVGKETNRSMRSLYTRLMNGDRTEETRDLLFQQLQRLQAERARYDSIASGGRQAAIEWKYKH